MLSKRSVSHQSSRLQLAHPSRCVGARRRAIITSAGINTYHILGDEVQVAKHEDLYDTAPLESDCADMGQTHAISLPHLVTLRVLNLPGSKYFPKYDQLMSRTHFTHANLHTREALQKHAAWLFREAKNAGFSVVSFCWILCWDGLNAFVLFLKWASCPWQSVRHCRYRPRNIVQRGCTEHSETRYWGLMGFSALL